MRCHMVTGRGLGQTLSSAPPAGLPHSLLPPEGKHKCGYHPIPCLTLQMVHLGTPDSAQQSNS